jgi:hypothetical protein
MGAFGCNQIPVSVLTRYEAPNKRTESLVRHNLLVNNNKMSTPPRRRARKHWETPIRTQVLTLLEEGYSQRQISCRTGVPQSTVARWNKNHNLLRRNHFRTGRPKKLTKHDIHRLIGILRSDWEGRKFSWGKLAKKAVFMYPPKRLNEHLIGGDIIDVGLAKSRLSIGKLSTLKKHMQ